MLSSVSYVCLGVCAGMWVSSKGIYVVVNFLFQLIFIFPLFLGMVMYAKQFKTKEKQNLTERKN